MNYGELTDWIINILQSSLTITNKFPFPVSVSWHEENTNPKFVVKLESGETHVMVNTFQNNLMAFEKSRWILVPEQKLCVVDFLIIQDLVVFYIFTDNMIQLYCTVMYSTALYCVELSFRVRIMLQISLSIFFNSLTDL